MTASKTAAPRGGKQAASPAAKKKAPAAERPAPAGKKGKKAKPVPGAARVSVVKAGGYTVFGSPVRPAHLSAEQIAAAIADLD